MAMTSRTYSELGSSGFWVPGGLIIRTVVVLIEVERLLLLPLEVVTLHLHFLKSQDFIFFPL